MNNFLTRTLTGAVFVAVMIGGIWWNYWSMAALFLVISIAGVLEFYSLVKKQNYSPQIATGIILTLLGFIFIFICYINLVNANFRTFAILRLTTHLVLVTSFLFLFLSFVIELYRKKENSFGNICITLLAPLYVAIPFLMLISYSTNFFTSIIYHYEFILGFFFLIWSNDTFAYLVGRAIGKTKLFERISPKKTWEGTIGGILCTQGIAYLLSIYFTELPLRDWMIVGAIVSVFGTLGDLVESMFKRSVGVKDSGTLLPGHGGILDRFDGVFLSAPFVVTYIELMR